MNHISKLLLLLVAIATLQNCVTESSKAIPIEDKPINVNIEEDEKSG